MVAARLALPGAADQWPWGRWACRGAPLGTGFGNGRLREVGWSSGVTMAGMPLLRLLLGASSTAMLGTLIEGTGPLGLSSAPATQIDGMFALDDGRDIDVLSSATTILGISMGFASGLKEEDAEEVLLPRAAGIDR